MSPHLPSIFHFPWSQRSEQSSMHNYSAFDPNSTPPPEVLFQYESIFVNASINFATVALVFYEYIITLPNEVKYFWRRRFTGASLLFFANRYLVLAYSAALLRGARPFTKHSCVVWSEGVRAVEILSYIPWAAFSGLRAYALRGHSSGWLLGALVFLLSIVPVCINFADFRWAHLVSETRSDCSVAILEPPGLSIRLTIVSRVSFILADLTVIITTWAATYGTVRMLRTLRCTLLEVLLRNGTVYFIILLLLNAMHLAFCARSIFQSAAHGHISDVVAVVEPLTSILVSRFLLDLQRAAHSRPWPHAHSDSASASANADADTTSINFERVVGSIRVVYPEADEDEDKDEGEGEDGEDSWSADEAAAAAPPLYSARGWGSENPFRDVELEAAGTASLTDMSFRTGSSCAISHR